MIRPVFGTPPNLPSRASPIVAVDHEALAASISKGADQSTLTTASDSVERGSAAITGLIGSVNVVVLATGGKIGFMS